MKGLNANSYKMLQMCMSYYCKVWSPIRKYVCHEDDYNSSLGSQGELE